jgi:cation diffusion facilitator family transporter
MNDDNKQYYALAKKSSYCALGVVTIILLCKAYACVATNSLAIFASLLDSCFDLSASLVNLFALTYSAMPADDNHRFGHNKIEDIAIFAQSIFFIGSSAFMLFNCATRFVNPEEVMSIDIGINIMLLSVVMNLALVLYQSQIIKKTNSNLVEADKLHFLVDALTSFVTLMALFFVQSFPQIDIIGGILISIYMFHSAFKLLRKSLKNLLDEEFSKEEKEQILFVIAKYHEVRGVHELKTRNAGNKKFIQFHIELDGNMNLITAHSLSDSIMAELQQYFPKSEILIHQDPEGFEDDTPYKEELKREAQ